MKNREKVNIKCKENSKSGMAKITKSYSSINKMRMLSSWPYMKRNFFKRSRVREGFPISNFKIEGGIKYLRPNHDINIIYTNLFTQKHNHVKNLHTFTVRLNDAIIRNGKVIRLLNVLKKGQINYKELALKRISKFERDLYGDN
jgi:hypothetical protein